VLFFFLEGLKFRKQIARLGLFSSPQNWEVAILTGGLRIYAGSPFFPSTPVLKMLQSPIDTLETSWMPLEEELRPSLL
jgi:hypothetical protein